MRRYNFNGDFEDISPNQLDYISSVLETRGFKGPDVTIEAVGSAADNYIANVKRIVINENGTSFKMIAKFAPENPMMREMYNMEMMFHNEHVVYSEILPTFRQLQQSANLPEEELFRFAELYGSNTQVPHEVILMEDLKEDEYIMLDRFKPLSNDCVKIVLKNLAIFHSLSFVLKYQEPETFSAFKSKLQNMFTGSMTTRPDIKMFFEQMEQGALSVVQDDKYKKLIKGSISDIFHHALKVEKMDADSKYAVIQQGDGWMNNILFKMKNETPIDCALIDYQLAKESNPAFDVMYMLFNSTSHEQRQRHYYGFLDYYHTEMDKSLNNYGLKVSFVFPKDQLDADLKRYAKYMFSTSVMVSNFIIKKTEDASKFKETMLNADVDNTEEATKAALVQDQETALLYKSKIEGLVDSFLEFGLFRII